MKEQLENELIAAIQPFLVPDYEEDAKMHILMILSGYEVRKEETSLTVYEGDVRDGRKKMRGNSMDDLINRTEDDCAYCVECDPEVKCLYCGHHVAERPFEVYCNIMCKWVNEKDYCTMFEPTHTMEEFMYGQDMGNPEDGSL